MQDEEASYNMPVICMVVCFVAWSWNLKLKHPKMIDIDRKHDVDEKNNILSWERRPFYPDAVVYFLKLFLLMTAANYPSLHGSRRKQK